VPVFFANLRESTIIMLNTRTTMIVTLRRSTLSYDESQDFSHDIIYCKINTKYYRLQCCRMNSNNEYRGKGR
jgi:hypothetical protein